MTFSQAPHAATPHPFLTATRDCRVMIKIGPILELLLEESLSGPTVVPRSHESKQRSARRPDWPRD